MVESKLSSERALLLALSRVVQERRWKLSISQEQLAERAGMHRTYISDIERGARNLSLMNLSRLAEALEMSVSELVKLAELKVAAEGDREGN